MDLTQNELDQLRAAMTDKPQVLFGPWVEVSLVKGVGSIVEFPLGKYAEFFGKETERVKITLLGEKQEGE